MMVANIWRFIKTVAFVCASFAVGSLGGHLLGKGVIAVIHVVPWMAIGFPVLVVLFFSTMIFIFTKRR